MPAGPGRSARPPLARATADVAQWSIQAAPRRPNPGDSAIPPFIAAYYLISLAAVVLAWLKGGHPERLGATTLLVVFGVSFILQPMQQVRVWNVAVSDAAVDLGLALFFGWLAFSRQRWWPLFVTAAMVLTLLVHVSMFLVPTLGAYADVSARVGLGIAMGVGLLVGVAERWLSGEQAVSDRKRWNRRRPPGPHLRPDPHSPEGNALSRLIS